ncbi:MAG: hypothetical protein BGP20_13245 [Thiobacillus sp. 63-78]|uniref:DUF302 domain-containing protein n=1 Tax=Thiobacillus sp. 63-78 TaxID=1895859 RepID=UPI00095A3CE6|nr:DUF302 domain-containing protein [Thiobacillus sp. 63-78]MBN8762387.1 DUF302 domain-containing protein [Thiobacillus sp.]MBN8773286.1 DUF302 domain-containing protein [Thiobacillus sp.]OJZ06414.1 MAG: hypothetical protein BGP20_13245 [Thiobacillus sp. 63-78]
MRRYFLALLGVVLGSLVMLPASQAAPAPSQPSPTAGVYKVAIDPGVSLADAAESMRLRANALNLKLVAELPLSKQVEAVTGKPQRTITIFQFCDAVTAKELLDMSMDFAIYMPCRISMIEDADGRGWLIMQDINVDLVAKEKKLQGELTRRIKKVRDGLIDIMKAGAHGEL